MFFFFSNPLSKVLNDSPDILLQVWKVFYSGNKTFKIMICLNLCFSFRMVFSFGNSLKTELNDYDFLKFDFFFSLGCFYSQMFLH